MTRHDASLEILDASLEILAVGHAIVDVLAHCDDAVVSRLELAKGTMTLVDQAQAEEVYQAMGPGVEISGGSAANTAVGVASLGGVAAFIGKVGDDEFGHVFSHDIRAAGVSYEPPGSATPATARCHVLVTPDAQRTMATFLGGAGEITPSDVDRDLVAAASISYLEGYLVGTPAEEALDVVAATARQAGQRVALTLSDPFWVDLHHDRFQALLEDVDVLLANEAEALALTGAWDLARAVAMLREDCSVVTVTCGERGAVVAGETGETQDVPAHAKANVVDTTGAGDLYAAGFLLGISRHLPLVDCAGLGCLAASEVISHDGARPATPLLELAAAEGWACLYGTPAR